MLSGRLRVKPYLLLRVLLLLLPALHGSSVGGGVRNYDEIIAATHARAAAVREVRLAAFDLTNFDAAANGHTQIPPETSPRSQQWTGKGYQLIAAG